MPAPVSAEQVRAIRALSADGQSSKEIAAKLGLATMQVAALRPLNLGVRMAQSKAL